MITFVLGVYNNLELTKSCYNHIRSIYPTNPLVISSGGSTDGTKEWLESLEDDELSFIHDDERISFSTTYNNGIKLVDTEKLVLIHNDMVISSNFLENLEKYVDKKTLLSYTTIEPPLFNYHIRPGKINLDLGDSFENFNYTLFDEYIKKYSDENLYNGASFFMCGYKSMFEDVGYFDEKTFVPAFCEDDDFILRAKLKGYKLKTTGSAIVYHFISKTSRQEKDSTIHEYNSNLNFIRKWGTDYTTFLNNGLFTDDNLYYKRYVMAFKPIDEFNKDLEPFFSYDIENLNIDVMITEVNKITNEDINTIKILQFILPHLNKGKYMINNLMVTLL